MTSTNDMRTDALLLAALRARRAEPPEPGPSRLELERRRLLARLADVGRERAPARPAAPRLRWAAAAAVVVAALAAAVAFFPGHKEEAAVSLTGAWRLEPGDAIAKGALIRVPDGARAALLLGDGTRIAADGGAALRFAGGDGIVLRLVEGRIAADVAKRDRRKDPFVVSTEFGDVAVMGTTFAVAVDDDGATVRLYEGRVRLTSRGREISLSPGQRARATRQGLASLGDLGRRDTGSDLALLGAEPRRGEEARRPAEAEADVAGQPAAAEPAGSPKEEPADRGSLAAEARGPALERGPAPDPEAELAALWRARRYAEILQATEAPSTAAGPLLYRGKALGALGRWLEAGRAFEGAAKAGGDLGREAAYLSATALHTAGDFAGSLAMAERAASLGGPNADHAARLAFVSLTELGRYADAAASASQYLAAHPNGAHVGEARFAVSTGSRLARRWAEAADGYAAFLALGRGAPQMRDDAAFYVGYCRLKAGAIDSGRKSLEQYLTSTPSGRHAEQARAALSQ